MEALILLVLFILIPLANYVLERMRRRYEASPDARRRAPDSGVRRQPAPVPPSVTRRERVQPAPDTVVRRREREPRPSALLRNKRDLRRAVVVMTILGPCRAYDPPDSPEVTRKAP